MFIVSLRDVHTIRPVRCFYDIKKCWKYKNGKLINSKKYLFTFFEKFKFKFLKFARFLSFIDFLTFLG